VADLGVTNALTEAARRLEVPHHVGIGHCKDAFYAEFTEGHPRSEEWIKRWTVWRRAGVLATSMESAAIFVISSVKGLRAGEVLAVVGLAYKDHPVLEGKKGIEEAVKVAIEAVRILEGH
jgi:uridine phosphorylase